MPGTVRYQAAIQVEHGPFQFQWASNAAQTQSGRGMQSPFHLLMETPETISYGEVSGPGLVILHNIGTTSLVWGVLNDEAFVPVGLLEAGEFALFRLPFPKPILQAKATSSSGALLQAYFMAV